MTTCRLALLTAAVLVFAAGAGAPAAQVTPIVASDELRRVHEVVALSPDGAKLAVTASYGGQFLRDSVFVLNGDGGGMARVDDGSDTGHEALRASPDGSRLAWSNLGDTLTIASAGGDGRWRIDRLRVYETGYAFEEDGTLLVSLSQGQLRAVRPGSGSLTPVRFAGLGLRRGDRARRTLTLSDGSSAYGACVRVQPRGRRTLRLGLGLMDDGRMRFRMTGVGFGALPAERRGLARRVALPYDGPPCRVSDDGTTVATLASVGDQRFVVVRRGERLRAIRVPRRMGSLRAMSPSGRHLFLAAGEDFRPSDYDAGQADPWMTPPVALLDTRTGRVRVVDAVKRHARLNPRLSKPGINGRVVWSAHESYAAMPPTPEGTIVVSTREAGDAFIPSPPAPPGVAWTWTQAAPIGFSLDERRVVFTMEEQDARVTGVHPYSAPVGGGPVTPLLSDSMASFGRVLLSPDRGAAWLASSTSCREIYPVALFRVSLAGLFETPFLATPAG